VKPLKWIVTYGCKLGLHIMYRIDAREMKKVPMEGPLIAFTNHSGRVEAPLLYCELAPREKCTGLSKIENFDSAFFNFVFKQWEIIPVHRGEADLEAMRACLEKLKEGYILGMAPEGTRNETGSLKKAQGGIAVLGIHSGSPIIPVAHWGGIHFKENIRRWRRTPFTIRVGRLFRLDARGQRITREVRQEMADEMMYQLALLLPEEFRGAYADLSLATTKWLNFGDALSSATAPVATS
jgi:1-acyl-sn-glycerol-3-phosphate acyltransferase